MPVLGSPMGRDQITDLLERGIRMRFFQEYQNRGEQYSQIFNVDTSVKQQETDVVMAGLSLFQQKAEGAPYAYDGGQEAWKNVYKHSTFALGIQITREGQEDDLYGYYTDMGKELGRSAAYTREVNAMSLFNNLSATVYTASGTGYTLLSTTQFRVDGGTWANRPSQAMDISIDTLEFALQDWRKQMVDQRGLKIQVDPSVLLVGPSDWMLAERILGSSQRPQGNDNDTNIVAKQRLTLMVSDFITDDSRWFLLAPKERTALMYFNRRPTTMERNDDPNNGNMIMVGSYRVSSGATNVTGIYGSP